MATALPAHSIAPEDPGRGLLMTQIITESRRGRAETTTRWRFLSTPPLPGAENMRIDAETLAGVERGEKEPILRFFRFCEPTVTYGRLQKPEHIRSQVPSGWPAVQRPTGGGVVLHQGDLCLSLCWPIHTAPLPPRIQDQYRWIHAVILETLSGLGPVRMATCRDVGGNPEPFSRRQCFINPVGFDLLKDQRKVVGGAIARRKHGVLYQGSIQMPLPETFEALLRRTFEMKLTPPASNGCSND